jgi:outer membrane protein assembly factor BamB
MFRGPDRNGISQEQEIVTSWSATENVKWKAPLPQPGNSSPIVSAGKVFVTCAEDRKGFGRSLYCFDRANGKQLWVRTVRYEQNDPTHQTNPYSASSPAADGQRVVVWHGSAGLYCYDHTGNEIWHRDLGVFRHIWGYAGSPVIVGDVAFLNCGPGVRTFVTAINLKNGETIWQTDEEGGAEDKQPKTDKWIGSWNTPVPIKVNGQDQLLVHMPLRVSAYDPKTGKVIWFVTGPGELAYCDPVVDLQNALAVATSGYGGPAIGLKLAGGNGDVTNANRLWRATDKIPQRIGTGVIFDGKLYAPGENVIQCIDIKTGQELWRHRPEGASFWSPTAATKDGKILITAQNGTTFVIRPDPTQFSQVSANALGDSTNSAPAISDGQVFIRTSKHVWCLGGK